MQSPLKRKLLAGVAGCLFFGVAMGARDFADSMWLRATIAAVGAGGGVGVAIAVAHWNRRFEGK